MCDVFARDHIRLHVKLQDKDSYLEYIARLAVQLGIGRDVQGVYEGLVLREKEFSTNLGGGIAIPHTKSGCIIKPAILVLKPHTPVSWGNDGEEAVKIIISILSNSQQGGNAHLDILSSLARKLIDGEFKKTLANSCKTEEIFLLVAQALHS